MTVKGANFNNVMIPPAMTDAEIAAVLTYIRNSWGNEAPMVTKEMVAKVRAEAEKEFWAQRDPINRLSAHLIEQGLATADELQAIEKEIDAEVADCVEFALAAPEPKAEELTRYIWAED